MECNITYDKLQRIAQHIVQYESDNQRDLNVDTGKIVKLNIKCSFSFQVLFICLSSSLPIAVLHKRENTKPAHMNFKHKSEERKKILQIMRFQVP